VTDALRARLARQLEALGAPSDARALDALCGWMEIHGRWSRAFNLTGTRDPETLIDRHLADCAAILPFLPPGRLVDVGSGAGLPGLVVALLQPERPMILVDSLAKRTRFLEQAARELGADQVRVIRARVEHWTPDDAVAGVLVRAVAPLARLIELLGHLLSADTPLLAMKGPGWQDEARLLPDAWAVTDAQEYRLPSADVRRVLVSVRAADGRQGEAP
jgi:16S rRNA (guanine527-N7)-methyltransferase